MAIHFACACGRGFSVQDRRAGQTRTCPACGQAVRVPSLGVPRDRTLAESPGGALLRYALWPAVVIGGLGLTYVGTRQGHALQLVVMIIYLPLLVLLTLLEGVLPRQRRWAWRDGQTWQNLGHTVLATFVVSYGGAIAIVIAFWRPMKMLRETFGLAMWPTHWPAWVQVVLLVAVWDFIAYWTHRWSHEWRWLWRVHALHHSADRVHTVNAGRIHLLDTFKTELIALPLSLLVGAPLEVVAWYAAFFKFIGVLSHCNLDLRLGWLNYLFNTPVVHRWHHSIRPEEGNRNYSQNLILWDHLFRTYYCPADRPPDACGIAEAMPGGFFGQLLSPFTLSRPRDPAPATPGMRVSGPARP